MMRKRRRKNPRWGEIAGWTLGVALVLPSAELALRIPSQWAEPAAWAGLAIALAATIGFFVVKRHSWLLAAPISFGLASSFTLALVNGWDTQIQTALTIAKAGIAIGSLVVFVAMVVLTTRLNHHIRDVMREAGEQIVDEGLFRDDGERIMVYASRPRLLLRTVPQVGFLIALVFAWRWVHANALSAAGAVVFGVLIALCACMFCLLLVLTIVRLMIDTPTLIITADGIVDNGSQIAMGRGLLRWDEIFGVRERTRSLYGVIALRSLSIMVTDAPAINARQWRWQRILAFVHSGQEFGGYIIWRALLDRPAARLVTDIEDYIRRHAPPDSYHAAVTRSTDESEDPDAEHSVEG